MTEKKILLTGASGFVGEALLHSFLKRESNQIVAASRAHFSDEAANLTRVSVGDISGDTDWSQALIGVNCVVHLANIAHNKAAIVAEYDRVNVEGTLNLARQALKAGVRRFIFISSIGVNGVQTLESPFDSSSVASPAPGYAFSKWRAEEELRSLASGSTMDWVIVRPPLIYAAHAPGNFGRLLKLLSAEIPLPFGTIDNKRSLIALENFIDFIQFCTESSRVNNQVILVSDGADVSTPDIMRLIAKGMGKKKILLPVPVVLLKIGLFLLGRRGLYTQLCASLIIDSSKARKLGWKPPVDVREALETAGRNYLAIAHG